MADITTLQEVYNMTDFSTDNLWYLDFIKMPTTAFSITAKELHLRCQSFQVPQTSVKNLAVTLHNHVKNQSTTTTQPTEISIPFIETLDMRTSKFFVAWREACSRSNDNYVSLPSARQATIQFYTYTPQHEINYVYRIEYAEIRDVGSITYNDGSNPGAIIRTVKMNVGAVYEMS